MKSVGCCVGTFREHRKILHNLLINAWVISFEHFWNKNRKNIKSLVSSLNYTVIIKTLQVCLTSVQYSLIGCDILCDPLVRAVRKHFWHCVYLEHRKQRYFKPRSGVTLHIEHFALCITVIHIFIKTNKLILKKHLYQLLPKLYF